MTSDEPARVYFDYDTGPSAKTYDHVTVLASGWLMCRNGTLGSSEPVEKKYYPPNVVRVVERRIAVENREEDCEVIR